MLEKFYFDIYKSISPEFFSFVINIVNVYRKFKNKPAIPIKDKLAQITFPDFKNDNVIMIHGVSVGEIQSLENMIKKIHETFPTYKLVITTGTVTGQELAKKKYSQYADFITYFPFDVTKTVNKFLNAINPRVILIAETELWPNFSYCAKEKNIPLYIINARISDKSYPSYLKIKKFLKPILNCYKGIYCQSELDKNRFINIGAGNAICDVMKNLKFETDKKECEINLQQTGYKVLIAGSTHKGEDKIVLDTYAKLKNTIKDLKLILAPRHLTRLDEIKSILSNYDFNFGYRTTQDNFVDKDIIIIDTLGELSKLYALADVAFIGGSFNNTGGHNPLEAIIYSKPVISGPSIKNFRDIYSILERESSAFVVKNENEFYSTAKKLLSDEVYYKTICNNCSNCFNNQQGALDFVINKLKSELLH